MYLNDTRTPMLSHLLRASHLAHVALTQLLENKGLLY